jgi:hypothetical protein
MNLRSTPSFSTRVMMALYLFLQTVTFAQEEGQSSAATPRQAGPRPPAHSPPNPLDLPFGGDTFYFGGGTPYQFTEAVRRHFAVQWGVSTVPDEMRNARIPAIRMKTEVVRDVEKLVRLYNSLGEKNLELGYWVLEGAPERPDALMLVPRPKTASSAERPAIMARAVALRDIPKESWGQIEKEIEQAALYFKDELQPRLRDHATAPMAGEVRFHNDSRILLIYGTRAYVEMAESIVTAHVENSRAGALSPLAE